MLWNDTRIVTHGAAEVLKTLLQNIFLQEMGYMQDCYGKTVQYYDEIGDANIRQAMIDVHTFKILLQEHRRIYVEQAPLRVRAMCAHRSATTQRNLDGLFRRVVELEQKFSSVDSRFKGFEPINQKARQAAKEREPEPEEKPEPVKGKAPPKAS